MKQTTVYYKISNTLINSLKHRDDIKILKKELKERFLNDWFEVLTFDNLALEQLKIQELIPKENWKRFYLGTEGNASFYYDAVSKKAFRSSTEPLEKELTGNNAMFIFNGLKKYQI